MTSVNGDIITQLLALDLHAILFTTVAAADGIFLPFVPFLARFHETQVQFSHVNITGRLIQYLIPSSLSSLHGTAPDVLL
jgi:hypothetical protein